MAEDEMFRVIRSGKRKSKNIPYHLALTSSLCSFEFALHELVMNFVHWCIGFPDYDFTHLNFFCAAQQSSGRG